MPRVENEATVAEEVVHAAMCRAVRKLGQLYRQVLAALEPLGAADRPEAALRRNETSGIA
jgi:hypothetical protein